MKHMVSISEPLYTRLKAMAALERRNVTAQLATILDANLPTSGVHEPETEHAAKFLPRLLPDDGLSNRERFMLSQKGQSTSLQIKNHD